MIGKTFYYSTASLSLSLSFSLSPLLPSLLSLSLSLTLSLALDPDKYEAAMLGAMQRAQSFLKLFSVSVAQTPTSALVDLVESRCYFRR